MKRVVLVHWKQAQAEPLVQRLTRAGYRVELTAQQGGQQFRDYRNQPPDAFVIDLSRLPSHGRAVAVFLRQQKGTRRVPIVFVGGDPEKVAGVRAKIPDAAFTDWPRIRGALTKALKNPPTDPIVPGTMSGYSKTPLPKKLCIKDESSLTLLGAPAGFEKHLDLNGRNVTVRRQVRGRSDIVMLFAESQADMLKRLPTAKRALAEGGGLWIAWPKKTSGVATDLSDRFVRRTGLDDGLVDYKVCAIDQTWSGLLFAVRGAKRSK